MKITRSEWRLLRWKFEAFTRECVLVRGGKIIDFFNYVSLVKFGEQFSEKPYVYMVYTLSMITNNRRIDGFFMLPEDRKENCAML